MNKTSMQTRISSYFLQYKITIFFPCFLFVYLGLLLGNLTYANSSTIDTLIATKPLHSTQGSFLAWQQQCAKKNYHSCMLLGRAYLEGYKVLPNIMNAQKFLTLACENAIIDSCLIMHELTNTQDKNDVFARTLYQQTCNLNHEQSCLEFSQILMHNIQPDSPLPQKEQVLTLLKKICQLQNDSLCVRAKTFEANFMQSENNYMVAIFQEKLQMCQNAQEEDEADLRVCGEVGLMYANGDGTKQNKEQAQKYFQLVCQKQNSFCLHATLDSVLNP